MIACIQKGRGPQTSSFFCCSVMPPKQTVSFGCRQYVAFFQGYLIPRTNTVWLHLQIQSGFPNDCSCLAQRTVEHPHYITTPLRISLSYKGPLCFIYRTRGYERIFICSPLRSQRAGCLVRLRLVSILKYYNSTGPRIRWRN